MLKKFYEVHAERPFYGELVELYVLGPIVAAVLEKENAVEDFRKLIRCYHSCMKRQKEPLERCLQEA